MKLKLSDVLSAVRLVESQADEGVIDAGTIVSIYAEEAKNDTERRLWNAAYFYIERKPAWRKDEDIELPDEFISLASPFRTGQRRAVTSRNGRGVYRSRP